MRIQNKVEEEGIIKLSAKQKQSLKEATARYNFWIGAVRSGKSFISLIAFVEFMLEAPEGDFCILGKSLGSIKRNVIAPLRLLLGDLLSVSYGKSEAMFAGRTIHLIGCTDERSEGKIRGSSFAGAYVDEVTLIPQVVFEMLKSRLSIAGSRLYGTTNPDSPLHWFYTSMLSNPEIDVRQWTFYLEDNPSLDKVFVEALKKEYVGLWYQRFIESKWVVAEGAIFDFFDQAVHVVDSIDMNFQSYISGIDYGTRNAFACVVVGINPTGYPHYCVLEEYVWDSAKMLRQKSDSEYAVDVDRFLRRYPVRALYIDPSAASLKVELRNRGIQGIHDAENDVDQGIRLLTNLITSGDMKIDKRCENLIKEIQTYSWDERAALRGIDKPVKQNDHCFVGEMLVWTDQGEKRIDSVKVGDKVLTSKGTYEPVLKVFSIEKPVQEFNIFGTKIIGTPDHKFFCTKEWKELGALIQSDIICVKDEYLWNQFASDLMASSTEDTRTLRERTTQLIIELEKAIASKDMDFFIETYGDSIMEKYPQDTIFIMSTVTPKTTLLKTCGVSQRPNTFAFTVQKFLRREGQRLKQILIESDLLQSSGMPALKVENGIDSMGKTALQKQSLKILPAENAEPLFNQKKSEQNFVILTVKLSGVGKVKLIMSKKFVLSVLNNSLDVSTQESSFAVNPVQENALVYSLHVANTNSYFANGILVMNCIDSARYALYTHLKKGFTGQAMTPEELRRLQRPWEANPLNQPFFDSYGNSFPYQKM